MKFSLCSMLFVGVFFCFMAWAGEVPKLPEGRVAASYEKGDQQVRAIAWYYTSDEPLNKRAVAQTFKSGVDGALIKLVFPLEEKGRISDFDIENLNFAVNIYEQGPSAPEARPNVGSAFEDQSATAKISEDGLLFIITLSEPVPLMTENYYTFILDWRAPDPTYKISLEQAVGNESSYRWHRGGRDSWVRSPDSLLFYAITEDN